MNQALEQLAETISGRFAGQVARVESRCGELTFEVAPAALLAVCQALRDEADWHFEQLIDLCGVDYVDVRPGRVEHRHRDLPRLQPRAPRPCARARAWSRAPEQALRGRLSPAERAAQPPPAPARLVRTGRAADGRFGHRHLEGRRLVRARGVRPLRHPVPRPPGPAAPAHGLRLHRPSVPQGFPAVGQRRGPLRPGQGPRGLRARQHRAPHAGAARDPRRQPLRGRARRTRRKNG